MTTRPQRRSYYIHSFIFFTFHGLLHRVVLANVADVSEIFSASLFNIDAGAFWRRCVYIAMCFEKEKNWRRGIEWALVLRLSDFLEKGPAKMCILPFKGMFAQPIGRECLTSTASHQFTRFEPSARGSLERRQHPPAAHDFSSQKSRMYWPSLLLCTHNLQHSYMIWFPDSVNTVPHSIMSSAISEANISPSVISCVEDFQFLLYVLHSQNKDLRVSLRWLWRMASFGMLRRVALVRTDDTEELRASIIRVTRIGELGTTLAVTSNRRTLRFVA
jgi:hypothetical protein